MNKLSAIFALFLFCWLPEAAQAYVGPGAGLSLLGALWALLAAVATAVVFVIAWPIRRMRRRRREAKLERENPGTEDRGPEDKPLPARQEARPPGQSPAAGEDRADRLQRP